MSKAQNNIREFYAKYNNGQVCALDDLLDEATNGMWNNTHVGINKFKSKKKEEEEVCKKCKKGTFVVIAKQTRSADEGMSMFKCCSVCKYTFQVG